GRSNGPMIARLVAGSAAFAIAFLPALAPPALAQSRIQTMPGYDHYQAMQPRLSEAFKTGSITPEWAKDSKSFAFSLNAKRFSFDVETLKPHEVDPLPSKPPRAQPTGAPSDAQVLARGRGIDSNVLSPDKKWRALTRDMNLYLKPEDGGREIQVT